MTKEPAVYSWGELVTYQGGGDTNFWWEMLDDNQDGITWCPYLGKASWVEDAQELSYIALPTFLTG